MKEAVLRTPLGTDGTARAMPSSFNGEESAMSMSDGGVPVSTARASTEKASSIKQLAERVAEKA